MHCEQIGEMMSARLDGCLDNVGIDIMEDHLAACSVCQAKWHRLQMLDRLFASAPMMRAPSLLRAQVIARINRREQARRTLIGGTALVLGAVALALLVLAPLPLGLFKTLGITPALMSGGPETLAQILSFFNALAHTLLVLVEQFSIPLVFLGLCSLGAALVLNGLWIGTMRRLRVT
jgi:predicted anti-sigma-YlaC factor YlaD